MNSDVANSRDFRMFVEAAQAILSREHGTQVRQLEEFVERARSSIVADLKPRMPTVIRALRRLRSFLMPHDLLQIAGLTHREDAYTELIAWAIDPRTHQDAAFAIQRRWLERIGVTAATSLQGPSNPRTQLWTATGRPDLVLPFSNLLVIVEAKTLTKEHETGPENEFQTIVYPMETRQALGMKEDMPTIVVFLTLDGCSAKNPSAKSSTYLEFALATIEAIDGIALPPPLLHSYRIIVNHFIHAALPPGQSLFDWPREFLAVARRDGDDAAAQKYAEKLSPLANLLTG